MGARVPCVARKVGHEYQRTAHEAVEPSESAGERKRKCETGSNAKDYAPNKDGNDEGEEFFHDGF